MILLFCNDGILRVESNSSSKYLPAKFIQDQLNKNDFEFFAKFLTGQFKVEKGITFGQFVKCFEPWGTFFQTLCGKDIQSYINELKKPINVTKMSSESTIVLNFDKHIRIHKEYKISKNSMESEKTPFFDIDNQLSVTEKRINDDEFYSLTFTPFNEIRDLPLMVMNDYQLSYLQNEDESLFDKNHNNVFKNQHGFESICIIHHLNFFEFVTQFWENFIYSPVERDREKNLLMESIAQIDSNDVSPDMLNIGNDSIAIMPGAFDSVIDEMDHERVFWEKLIDLAKSEDFIVRIGKFEENIISSKNTS